MVVEAQSRVGGRFGAADGQVDTRVLVRTDKWYVSEKAWPIWSFVTRVYAGAINRDLSLGTTNAEISTDVRNVQFGGVQLYGVLIMLCIRRALDCPASAMYSWVVEAWRMFCYAYSLWNDARLGVLMLEVLAVLLDTKDVGVNLDVGCIKMTNVDLNALDVVVLHRDHPKVLPRLPEEAGIQSSNVGITRSDSEHSNVEGNGGTATWDSRRVRRKAKEGTRESSSIVTSASSLVWV